nr:copia-like retrotransposon [Tanacetum cinerariifolium]
MRNFGIAKLDVGGGRYKKLKGLFGSGWRWQRRWGEGCRLLAGKWGKGWTDPGGVSRVPGTPIDFFDLEKIMHPVIFLPDSVPGCGHIKNSLSDRLYGVYAPITDPQKLWSSLEFKYKQQEEGTNRYLISKFFDFQMVDEKPILEQVHELHILVNKLNVLSIPIPEMLQVGAVVLKLPPS